jgi:hypothetical protein
MSQLAYLPMFSYQFNGGKLPNWSQSSKGVTSPRNSNLRLIPLQNSGVSERSVPVMARYRMSTSMGEM